MSANGKDYDGPILECKNLSISYFTRAGEIPAVIDFSLTVNKGESIGLVGEEGGEGRANVFIRRIEHAVFLV